MTPHFSLATDDWIPVLATDGAHRLVSLETIFSEAATLRDLALPPAERIAVMRLLLCIAQAALRDDLEDMDQPETEAADLLAPKVADYLAKWRAAFALFGDGPRFLQFRKEGKKMKSSKLFLHLASGNNPTLFDHDGAVERSRPSRSLQPSRLALGLLLFQNFSQFVGSGHLGKGPAIVDHCIHVFRLGDTISKTILRNLIPSFMLESLTPAGTGRPYWEIPVEALGIEIDLNLPGIANARGTVLGRMIPLTRALWLSDDGREVVVANGLGKHFEDYPIVREPTTTGYLFEKSKTGEEGRKLASASLGKALWRDLHAVLALWHADDALTERAVCLKLPVIGSSLEVWTGAVITNGQAKIENIVDSMFSGAIALPAEFLHSETAQVCAGVYRDGLKAASRWEAQLAKAVNAFCAAMSIEPKRVKKLKAVAESRFWSLLNSHVADLFALVRNPASTGGTAIANPYGKDAWHRALGTAAGEAFRSVCLADGPRQLLAWGQALRRLHPQNPDKPSKKRTARQKAAQPA